MQSRTKSLLEQLINTFSGFLISVILVKFFFPEITVIKNLSITIVFTIASIIRGYIIRRIFNKF